MRKNFLQGIFICLWIIFRCALCILCSKSKALEFYTYTPIGCLCIFTVSFRQRCPCGLRCNAECILTIFQRSAAGMICKILSRSDRYRLRIRIVHILESSSLVCRHGRSSQFRSIVITHFLHLGNCIQRSVFISHRYRYRVRCLGVDNSLFPIFSWILLSDPILIRPRFRKRNISKSFIDIVFTGNSYSCRFDSRYFHSVLRQWSIVTICGQQESELRIFKVFHIPCRSAIRQLEFLLHFKVCRTVKRSRISFICVGVICKSLLISGYRSCRRYISIFSGFYSCVISGVGLCSCSCKVLCFGFCYSIGGSRFQTVDLKSLPIF